MIDLYDTATDRIVGSITPAELIVLQEALEGESLDDQDYYFSADTIDLLSTNGRASDHLLQLLRAALGSAEGVELRWQVR